MRPTLQKLFTFILVLSVAVPVHAETYFEAGNFKKLSEVQARVDQAYLESVLRTGVTPRDSIAQLKIYFKSAEDRKYLDSLLTSTLDLDRRIAARSFIKKGKGFKVTTKEGRAYTIDAADQHTLVLNSVKIKYDELSAEQYLTAVRAALKKSFISSWFERELSLLPRAEAQMMVVPLLLIPAVVAIVFVSTYSRSIQDDVTISEWFSSAGNACEVESEFRVPFESSKTAELVRLLKEEGGFELGTKLGPEECKLFADKITAKYKRVPGVASDLAKGDATSACTKAGTLGDCALKYKAASAAVSGQPTPKLDGSSSGR